MIKILSRKKKSAKDVVFSHAGMAVLIVFSLILLYSVFETIKKYSESQENKQVAIAEFTELQEKQIIFEEQIENLKTEEGIEENIRDKFSLAKEGEISIIIIDPPEGDGVDSGDKDKQGFFGFIKSLFSKEKE